MKRRSFILSLFAFLVGFAALFATAAPDKKIDNLKKEKQSISREIKDTNTKIKQKSRETSRQLSRLDALRADMERQDVIIANTRKSADSISSAMSTLQDSLNALQGQLDGLRSSYAKSLRKLQSLSRPTSVWAFVLSAPDVKQAWSRIRYLRQLSIWGSKRIESIKKVSSTIKERKSRLQTLSQERGHALERLDLASQQLARQQKETQSVVASLKKEESSLRAYLKEKQSKMKKLDNQIDRLIAEEQARQEAERKRKAAAEAERKKKAEAEKKKAEAEKKKAQQKASEEKKPETTQPAAKTEAPVEKYADEERRLTGSFESNKGRLLFPVAGKYTIIRPFGRQKHPELEHVETENSGIDIATKPGTSARAVFEGTVSAIFQQPGFNTIVMVRHGAYITIYAGLSSTSVHNGQTVKAGQTIGTIARDSDDESRAVLHFELRREREKLNPSLWVR